MVNKDLKNDFHQYKFNTDLSEKVATRDKVYSLLNKAILCGDLKPGQRLVESKLAESMNISRTPVREAIIWLEQKGLVIASPPKGMIVAPLPIIEELIEFYDISGVLRGLTARKAVRNITSLEIKELKEIIQKSEQYLINNSLKNISKLNLKFHLIIEKCSKSNELILLLDNVCKRTSERFSEIISQKKRQTESIKEHKCILKALIERNEELAEKLMIEHVENAKQTLIEEINIKDRNY